MKIVIDEKIPYLGDALRTMKCEVNAMPGNLISSKDVKDAEAIFVRTRTKCDSGLLDGSNVKFIGTATIGYDHIDGEYCRQNEIYWSNAPACNAGAVLQYIQSSIYLWCLKQNCSLSDFTLGIVGVGAIGSRVALWATNAGMRVLLNDPPREKNGENGFVSLDTIARECDIITFHPTLTLGGDFPSYHLADTCFFNKLERVPLVINASRGQVVDNVALLIAYKEKRVADVILDVWENEPNINKELLNIAFVATPHIAGYSAEGKLNATKIVLQKFADFTGYKKQLPLEFLPSPLSPIVKAIDESEAFLQIYNPLNDTTPLKEAPRLFENLRNSYNFRREPSAYKIILPDVV